MFLKRNGFYATLSGLLPSSKSQFSSRLVSAPQSGRDSIKLLTFPMRWGNTSVNEASNRNSGRNHVPELSNNA